MEKQTETPEPADKPKVAKRVSSAIKALQALQAEEAERRKAFRLQKEALERAAAVEAVALRRAARERQRMQEQRLCMRIGRLVFATLRQQGMNGTLLAAKDFDGWADDDRTELLSLITDPDAAAGMTPSDAEAEGAVAGLAAGSAA